MFISGGKIEPELLRILKEHISEQVRPQGRQYSLPIIMFLSIIAILMGAKNPIEIYNMDESKCKVNKAAFALSALRSFVINILHLWTY